MAAIPADLLEGARAIRAIGFDIDGVLTDGRLWYGNDGAEAKAFHVHDGLGLKLLQQAGIATLVISARASEAAARRLRELGVTHVHLGVRDKLPVFDAVLAGLGIGHDEAAYMGDDLPDLATLRSVGLAIVPADAHPWVRDVAHWITPRRAGKGAARDACDLLLQAQGKVEAILAHGEHP